MTRKIVLIIEDSPFFAKILSNRIDFMGGTTARIATSVHDARIAIEEVGNQMVAAVAGLVLPDGPEGQAVDLCLAENIPTIVLTGNYDQGTRRSLLARRVANYVVKSEEGVDTVIRTIEALMANPGRSVLIVDDSRSFRAQAGDQLRSLRFEVIEAENGEEGIQALHDRPEISAVIVDYVMPGMDGFEFVRRVREFRSADELALIGVSAVDDRDMPSRFLSTGADDFVLKPFEKQELLCRVVRNVELIEHIRALKHAAYTDPLTGIGNRKAFFAEALPAYEEAKVNGTPMAVGMLDIDWFKSINDTYGHGGGDAVLVNIAEVLRAHAPNPGVLARFGGEEFCILALGVDEPVAMAYFERLRERVEQSGTLYGRDTIRLTVSIGVAVVPNRNLDRMIVAADDCLYRAKDTGRNKVVLEA